MKGKRLFWLAVMVSSMLLIFMLSHQSGKVSSQMSEGVAAILKIERVSGYKGASAQPLFMGLSLRKLAHVVLYAGLGAVVLTVVKCKEQKYYKKVILTILICFVYSCLDELHQYFVPDRHAELTDILIDAIGYLSAVFVGWSLHWMRGVTSASDIPRESYLPPS